MKYLFGCFLFLSSFSLHACDERPMHFHEMKDQNYLESMKHYLDICDSFLVEGDLNFAKIYYDNACQISNCLTRRDAETDIRMTFSKLVLNMMYDKNKNSVKDFVKSIMDRIEYKEGKWIVDLENINF